MRLALLGAALMVLLLASVASAQTQLLTDSPGDVALVTADQEQSDPTSTTSIDLVGLTVEETKDDLIFTVSVSGLDDTSTFQRNYEVYFRVDDVLYMLDMGFRPDTPVSSAGAWAGLRKYDPATERYDFIKWIDGFVDVPTATLGAEVDRSFLVNSQGAPPFPGMVVDGFRVHASTFETGKNARMNIGPVQQDFPYNSQYDLMPNTGNGTLPLEITVGVKQSGMARLSTNTPMRASNGEATTFLYQVMAENLDTEKERLFQLEARAIPSNWEVTIPNELVEIGPNETLVLPILVSVPFAHAHGTFQTFILEMTDRYDSGTVGRAELGVLYPEIPQPAGHHDTLWLHPIVDETEPYETVFQTAFGFNWDRRLVMNAQQDYEAASEEPIPGWKAEGAFNEAFGGGADGRMMVKWIVPLAPTLEMGLDVDLSRTGEISFPIQTQVPLMQAQMTGRVVHVAGAENPENWWELLYEEGPIRTTVVSMQGAAQKDVTDKHIFTAELVPQPEADLIPYTHAAALVLEVNVTFLGTQAEFGPGYTPEALGGEMRLPLFEYRDPVDEALAVGAGLMVHMDTDAYRMGNPGDYLVHEFRLMDHGGAAGSYDLLISGPGHEWATIPAGRTVKIEESGETKVQVAIAIPESAADGDQSDIIVTAVNKEDPLIRGLVHFVVEADVDAEHEDDAQLFAQISDVDNTGKESPGPLVGLLLVGLAVAVRRRR